MSRSPSRRALYTLALATAMPIFVLGCPKKQPPPPEDAGVAPPPSDTGPLLLAPLDDDAGDAGDGGDADAGKKWTGPGMSSNEAKVRACCARLRSQFALLPNQTSPEVMQLKTFATQCDAIAAQVHTNPNAPELAALKAFPGCQ